MGQAAYQLSAHGSRDRNDNHSWEMGIRTENDARGVLSDALHDGLGRLPELLVARSAQESERNVHDLMRDMGFGYHADELCKRACREVRSFNVAFQGHRPAPRPWSRACLPLCVTGSAQKTRIQLNKKNYFPLLSDGLWNERPHTDYVSTMNGKIKMVSPPLTRL